MKEAINRLPGAPAGDRAAARPVRAAIYARYSSDMQKAASCDDQITIIRTFLSNGRLQSRKWPGAEIQVLPDWILKDEAQSGRSTNREGYQRIIEGIRSNAFDILLVDNLSRATRDLGGMMDLYGEIRFYGKELISASEGISTEDPSSKVLFATRGMVNDLENETRANCTWRGMAGKYLKGFVLGDIPYGYDSRPTSKDPGKGNKACDFVPSVNPMEAGIVRRIFEMCASGVGRSSICKKLNQEGVPWPVIRHGKGKGWSQTSVTKILSNEKYIGVWVWAKGKYYMNPSTGQTVWKERPRNEWIYLNGCPVNDQLAVIGRELWDRVQEIKREIDHARQQGQTRQRQVFVRTSDHASEHFLSGLLRCGVCGGNMIVVSGRRGGYYGCFEAHRKATCTNRSHIRARDVEARVLSELTRLLQQEDLARDLTDRYNRQRNAVLSNTEKQEVNLQEELTGLRAEVGHLITFLARGQDSDAVRTALTAKEVRVREIEKLLVGVVGLRSDRLFVTPAAVKEKLNRLEQILSQDPKAARQILRGLLSGGIRLTSPADVATLTIELNLPVIVREHLAAG